MSLITLVRHGQASFFGSDYDELSELGRSQGRSLGAWWAGNGDRFDRVFVGPLNRHRQTLDAVAEGYGDAAGDGWPEANTLEGLVEHQSLAVVRHVAGDDRQAAAALADGAPEAERHRILRHYFARYVDIVRDWATGRLDVPGIETWRQARRRVADTLSHLGRHRNESIAAFTSGGFVAMAVGELLRLDDEQVFDMSLDIRNSSLTELRVSSSRRSLLSFNAIPHLGDAARATLV